MHYLENFPFIGRFSVILHVLYCIAYCNTRITMHIALAVGLQYAALMQIKYEISRMQVLVPQIKSVGTRRQGGVIFSNKPSNKNVRKFSDSH